MRTQLKTAGLVVAVLAALSWAPPAFAASKVCDRACLEGLVGQYLQALPTHSAAKLPLAGGARFVENDQPLKLGEGTWITVTALGSYRHIFADPQTGQAAVITTIRENDVPAILDVRLKIENRRITEVESQIIRDARGAAKYEKLGAPEPLWLQAVPVADRVSRDVLVATTNKYFQGMQRNDPKGDYSFFDPDCNRLEHAEQTTNLKTPQAYGHSNDTDFSSMGCEAQFQTGFLGFVTEIRNRRYVVVDEERQAVFAFADFDHNGTVRVLHMSTGKDFVVPAYFDTPRTLQVAEAFRMRGDRIHRIEMTLTELPYGMKPAWDVPPAPARSKQAAKPSCDKACLADLLGQFLQAMIDHDPSHAPLAANVRYTENGQVLKPGDGLWNTATAIAIPGDGLSVLGPRSSAYKLAFTDPSGQIGYLGAVNENGTPGMMALRLRAEGRTIVEAEAFVVREESVGPRGGTVTLFKGPVLAAFDPRSFTDPDRALLASPGPRERTARNALAAPVNRYLDTIRYNSQAATPMPSEGALRVNGKPLPSLAGEVRNRRILVADEEHGLVLAVAMIDHDGRPPPAPATGAPWPPATNLFVALFKIRAGRIQSVEALERPVPFGMTTGWEP